MAYSMTQVFWSRLQNSSFFVLFLTLFLQHQSIEAQIISPRNSEALSPREIFIKTARSYIGTPYKLGGISRTGMDCSGLIYTAALEGLSVSLPRISQNIATYCTKVPDSAREPGDLVFFGSPSTISHIGIYLGAGSFLHSASDGSKTGVIISDLGENYWRKNYRFTGRFLDPERINWPSPGEPSSPEQNPVPEYRTPKPFEGQIGFSLRLNGTALWDLMPGNSVIRGASFGAELSWVRDITIYPGIGAGFTFDSRTDSFSIPLTISISTMDGFCFYLGTQIHLLSDPTLDNSPQFPGIIGLAWNSPESKVFGQNIGFYQAMEYSWFPDETFGTGFRFSTGINLRYFL